VKEASPIRNAIYYGIKPFVPVVLRRRVRRWFAARKRQKVSAFWPILPGSEKVPEFWPGWPDGKKFAFILTHDVEGQSGLDKCRELANLEKKFGFRSSFNFIPEGEYNVSLEFRSELTREGFEVGVHDLHHDGKLYGSRESFASQAAQINEYLQEWGSVGFRAGFMFHNLEWLHDLKISYDASTFDVDPFEPQPDGAGTIFPFWKSAPNGRGYAELPYTLPQDSTLFLLFGEQSSKIWTQKLDWVAANGGMALVNVHPDYLQFDGKCRPARTFPARYYEELLAHVRDKYGDSCWTPLPKELAAWLADTKMATAKRPVGATRIAPKARPSPRLKGKVAVVLYSHYASDPRPRRETEALVAAGMEADVICLRDIPSQKTFEKINGVNVYHVSLKRRRGGMFTYFFQYGYFFSAAFWRLTLWSLRQRYDLVHVHNMPDFLVFAAVAPRLRGAKIILDLHDPMPELFCGIYHTHKRSKGFNLLCGLEKCSINYADAVITPNLAFKEVFGGRTHAGGKINIVMNSPDTAMFDPEKAGNSAAKPAGKPFTVMYHGLLVERHGLDLAIDALPKIRGKCPNLALEIYGRHTDYVDNIMAQVMRLKLDDLVHYHGFKALTQIVEIINDIDLGLIPNRLNNFTAINFPTRIFEYLALNKPVLAPRTRGIADYFGEDEILYFEPGNVDDLGEKIAWAYSHPVELNAMMERGREVYRRNSWEIQKSELLHLVHALLGQNATGRGDGVSREKVVRESIEEAVPSLVKSH